MRMMQVKELPKYEPRNKPDVIKGHNLKDEPYND